MVALGLVATLAGSRGVVGLRMFLMGCLLGFPITIFVLHRRALDAALLAATRLATTDPLTGLLNRRGLWEAIPVLVAMAGPERREVALLLCDLDHFKRINDTLGHGVGDEVLRRVAAILRDHVRRDDVVARIGGEEIAVVASCAIPEQAVALAERIRGRVRVDCAEWQLTVSIGVAFDDGSRQGDLADRLDGWLTVADRCLYLAKASGRNAVRSVADRPSPDPGDDRTALSDPSRGSRAGTWHRGGLVPPGPRPTAE